MRTVSTSARPPALETAAQSVPAMTSRMWAGARAVALRWSRVLAALTAMCIVAGFFGRQHRYLEIASSFQLQYLIAGVVLTIMLSLLRSWRWMALAAACAVITGAQVLPWYMNRPVVAGSAGGRGGGADGPRLRLMLFNVHQRNTRFDDVIRHVRAVDPDVVVFQETHEEWFSRLQPLRESMPHAHHEPGGLMRGMCVFSKQPLADLRRHSFKNSSSPSMAWTMTFGGRSVAMLASHPWPPVTWESDESRKEQLMLTAEHLRTLLRPAILLGDLNSTMWGYSYREFERRSGLVNARRGFGVLPSHPMDELFVLRVPIDHCLLSDDLAVTDCRLGEPCGSDHAPLIVEVAVEVGGRVTP